MKTWKSRRPILSTKHYHSRVSGRHIEDAQDFSIEGISESYYPNDKLDEDELVKRRGCQKTPTPPICFKKYHTTLDNPENSIEMPHAAFQTVSAELDLDCDRLIKELQARDNRYTRSERRKSVAWADIDANESVVLVSPTRYQQTPESVNRYHVHDVTRARRRLGKLVDLGMHPHAVQLFYLLSLRGYVPLIPKAFKRSLEDLPDLLFAPMNELILEPAGSVEQWSRIATWIEHNIHPTPGRGPYTIRNSAVMGYKGFRSPENLIAREIKLLNKATTRNAGLDISESGADVPLHTVVTAQPTADYTEVYSQLFSQLKELSWRHRRWAQLPPLYGVVVSYTVMQIHDFDSTTGELRSIATFNFNDPAYDVWNALAVMIFVVHMMNHMVDLKERREDRFGV
ncbi:hypothetical protein K402DRAFT_464723 [Aulographum hederae CBS 113979]|uniref:Uncharacterized protein n=1 Tax=Aulographum hederae CBS 113979 TaxID=1176131 RepID=A0A6G1GWD4_9PEZI|nr:hypothetical protein K402DRAFT_464723 [Aulographum hederae CBS 113979]